MAKSVLVLAFAVMPGVAVLAQPAIAADPPAVVESADPYDPPPLAFTPTPDVARDFDKYFYFHRDNTSFAEALADIIECDYLSHVAEFGAFSGSRGLMTHKANLRVCMGYKGYRRYGLPRDLWLKFNAEDSKAPPPEAEHTRMMMQQARLASGPAPAQPALN